MNSKTEIPKRNSKTDLGSETQKAKELGNRKAGVEGGKDKEEEGTVGMDRYGRDRFVAVLVAIQVADLKVGGRSLRRLILKCSANYSPPGKDSWIDNSFM
ncbi:hypothetical protein SAY87_000514 [Trapa incisa]|uniref:Uncharacterized protein n=1 Tax=Trapa incisa TaxID=236973 RepID=A0AAN7GEN2_9MYRT|nr:hypothetical protein SAY87_000514 [Trapa incisa]